MAIVELYIYPPLSYKMTSKKVGPHIINQKVNRDETLGNLLNRLANANRKAWQNIFDTQMNKIRPGILAVLKGKAFAGTKASQIRLLDGDKIDFRIIYGGG